FRQESAGGARERVSPGRRRSRVSKGQESKKTRAVGGCSSRAIGGLSEMIGGVPIGQAPQCACQPCVGAPLGAVPFAAS
ncbi:MAG: hypothetical protein ACXW3V_04065, partial [Methylocystis sp.]